MPKVNDRFHIPDAKLIEGASRRLDEAAISGEITERDKTLIQEFINELVGTSSISASRQYKLTLELINNREFLPPYTECSVGDVFNGIQKLLHATKEDGSPRFKKNTLNDRVRTIKRITLWMVENGYSSMDERKLRKITPPGVDLMTKTADMLLTEEEVTRMIEAAKTSRDRALISVLYEAGARIGEIGAMTWGDLNFTSVNVACNTAGKTGKPRYIPLITSKPYLLAWKNDYPLEIKPDAYVFIAITTRKPVRYHALSVHLRGIAERAGIDRHITPHIFRHSRITHLIRQGVSESVIKMMMWGSITSEMFQTYAHLTNADIDQAMAEANGIKLVTESEEKKKKRMKPQQCAKCAALSEPTAKFCSVCGAPLSEEAKSEQDIYLDELREMMTEPEFLVRLSSILQARQNQV